MSSSQTPTTFAQVVKQASVKYLKSARRNKFDHIYSTLEDFTRAEPSRKRLVVIGCTGSGKSTLLNVLAGWRFVQSKETDYEFTWQPKPQEGEEPGLEPIFEATSSSESVTKQTSFANVLMRGDKDRELIVVDTPGHDDPAGCEIGSQEARDHLGELAADLHNKLKALGHVHGILVLHNDVLSNRLNPATYQILKMVDEKFALAGRSVWEHVIIGYSKCNGHETSWRSGLERKRKELCKAIQEKIPSCQVEPPVVAIGGGEIEPAPPSQDEGDGLEKLWEFLEAAEALDTSQLQPFEGADVKWQKLVDERDAAAAEAKAALIYGYVMIKVLMLTCCLFWRHMMLPAWLSLFLLNLPGLYDELAITVAVVYWIGPQDVLYSAKHFTRAWLLPFAEKQLGVPPEEINSDAPSAKMSVRAVQLARRWAVRANAAKTKKE